MHASANEVARLGRLARRLTALASPTRLHLLHELRFPRALHEIRTFPSISREGERPARPLARQSVRHHLDQLQDAGLVKCVRVEAGPRGERFVLNHQEVFAALDALRELTRLRAVVASLADATQPQDGTAPPMPPPPRGPRLLLAYGRDQGAAYPLPSQAGARLRVGRAAPSELVLDYDPFLSTVHSVIESHANGEFVCHDAGSRNGTWVNGERLSSNAARVLHSGDAIHVGRSLLVFQDVPRP